MVPIDPTRAVALDLDCRRVIEIVHAVERAPLTAMEPDAARELMNRSFIVLGADPPPVSLVEDRAAPGPAGPIPLRLYRPDLAGAPLPGILYLHGGGWVLGNLDTHDSLCRQLAHAAGAAVVAVDYRLAPEHKFPAAFDDAWAALRHVASHAASFGIDPHRLAVCGDSAGGNLAAAIALQARDTGGPALAAQVLFYPVTDMAMRHDSHRRNAEGFLLTAASVAWFRDHYLRDPRDHDDWRASPLRARHLAGLPPTMIITAGCDPLCDEGDEFAARLAAAGVAVIHRPMPGFIHGFIAMGRAVRAANRTLSETAAVLRGIWGQA